MKPKLKILLILTYIFLNGCGYNPIFSSKGSELFISEIQISDENKINRKIKNNFKNYIDITKDKNLTKLEISSNKSITVTSKDSKGDPKTFEMKIEVSLNIYDDNIKKNGKKFTKKYSYNNSTNKFDIKKYEREVQNNIVNTIIEEMTLFLLTK